MWQKSFAKTKKDEQFFQSTAREWKTKKGAAVEEAYCSSDRVELCIIQKMNLDDDDFFVLHYLQVSSSTHLLIVSMS